MFIPALRSTRRWVRGMALGAAIALAGCGGTAGQRPGPPVTQGIAQSDGGRPEAAPAGGPGQVFIVAMENQSTPDVVGSANAPYINGTLLPRYASASNFVDELPTLPSEPHYIWLEAGTNAFADHTFQTDDGPSASNSTASTEHLVTQIAAAGGGRDWMAYVEGPDLGAQPCPISSSGVYVARHDPFLFFQDVSGAPPSKTSAFCAAHHRSIDALAVDLASGTLPSYVFITPDLCHDMHGSSSCPAGNSVSAGDAWLSGFLPPLIDYVNVRGGIIFIVWDEGAKAPYTMPFIAVGPGVKPGYSSPVALSHASVLRSVEEILGLPILATAQPAPDLGDLFLSGAVP